MKRAMPPLVLAAASLTLLAATKVPPAPAPRPACDRCVEECLAPIIAELQLRGRIGAFLKWTDSAPRLTVPQLEPGGPAAKAGLKERDTIVAIDGRDARRITETAFRDHLAGIRAGTPIRYTVERGGKAVEVRVVPDRPTERDLFQWLGERLAARHPELFEPAR